MIARGKLGVPTSRVKRERNAAESAEKQSKLRGIGSSISGTHELKEIERYLFDVHAQSQA